MTKKRKAKNISVKTVRKPRGRPFKPGNNANPKGRPKAGQAIAEIVRRRMAECPAGQKQSYGETLVDVWIAHAFGSAKDLAKIGATTNTQLQISAWTKLAEYDSGKPMQRVEHSGHIGNNELDLSKLSERELRDLKKLQEKVIVQNNITDTNVNPAK